jgi:signal transduction histidine kinase
VQHISIGIIAFRPDGKVDMQHHAVRRLLGIGSIRHIKELAEVKNSLPTQLMEMKAGDRSLVKVFVENEMLQLSIYATEFRLRNESYVLVSLQNIHSELEEKEIESWQKLIRVLTHEIMNSITPISSLASTVTDMLFDVENDVPKARELDSEDTENIHDALLTIQSRSKGLLSFVEIYRNLTRVPKPNFRYFPVNEAFDKLYRLMKPRLTDQCVEFTFRASPPDLMLTADPDLMDQVFINLMLNALDALKGREGGRIGMEAYSNKNGRITIDVVDNGPGIKPDIIDKIFMPFFTSKKEGSGIGLSLSRQIMQLHKGSISVKSKPDEGTVFTLTF